MSIKDNIEAYMEGVKVPQDIIDRLEELESPPKSKELEEFRKAHPEILDETHRLVTILIMTKAMKKGGLFENEQ